MKTVKKDDKLQTFNCFLKLKIELAVRTEEGKKFHALIQRTQINLALIEALTLGLKIFKVEFLVELTSDNIMNESRSISKIL